MAKIQFKSYPQGQTVLFPSDLGENIPENDPVRIVSRIVDGLNIDSLVETYEAFGCPPYHPRMLLKVVFYAYMNNTYSCRRIENAMLRDIYYMWLSGNEHPSYSTINRFRSGHVKDQINSLFVQVVECLVEEGVLSLDVQYIDGTKVESVANKYTFVWRKTVERNKAKLEKKIIGVLEQIEEGIAQDNSEEQSPEPVAMDSASLQGIVERINAENARMPEGTKEEKKAKREREKAVRELGKMQQKQAEYERHLERMGERNSYSKTDPDATFMRMKEDAMNNGQTKPGYNVQISTENQYITNYGIYWRPTDFGTFIPFMTSFSDRYGFQSEKVVADSGYGNEQNYAWMDENEIEAFVKYNMFHAEDKRKYRNNPFLVQSLYYNAEEDYYVCPMGQHMEHIGDTQSTSDLGYVSTISRYRAQNCTGCPLRCLCYKGKADRRVIEVNHKNDEYRAKAKERLTSEEGLYHRSMRPIEPEAVFGDIKFDHGFKRFRLKGNAKVNVEFGLVALAHNLRKYARVQTLNHPVSSEPVVLELPKTDEINAA